MKNYMFLAIMLLSVTSRVFSQGYESTIEYDKKKQSAIAMDFYFSQDAVEKGLANRMDKMGFTSKDEKGIFNRDKGFKVYKGITVNEITSIPNNYYFKADNKNKKDNVMTTLYLVIMDNSSNNLFTNGAVDDRQRAKSFLSGLKADVEAADLEIKISNQEDVVAKAEKKLKTLKDDKESMEKKVSKLVDDIKKNITDQENAMKDIDLQKTNLGTLKGKRN